jgi:hypothetical protein
VREMGREARTSKTRDRKRPNTRSKGFKARGKGRLWRKESVLCPREPARLGREARMARRRRRACGRKLMRNVAASFTGMQLFLYMDFSDFPNRISLSLFGCIRSHKHAGLKHSYLGCGKNRIEHSIALYYYAFCLALHSPRL